MAKVGNLKVDMVVDTETLKMLLQKISELEGRIQMLELFAKNGQQPGQVYAQ